MGFEKKSAVMCFYYLIAVDNNILETEMDAFNSVAVEIDPENFASYKDTILEEYKEQIATVIDEEDYYDVISEGIDKYLVPAKDEADGVSVRLLLWDLLVVAFSDGDYSTAERRLIKHIVRIFGVEKDIFLEMEQLMKTNVAVTKEIEALENSDKPYNDIRPLVEELEERRNVIISAAKALIEDDMYEPVTKVDVPDNKLFKGAKKTVDKIGSGVASAVSPIASNIEDNAKKLWGNIFKKDK